MSVNKRSINEPKLLGKGANGIVTLENGVAVKTFNTNNTLAQREKHKEKFARFDKEVKVLLNIRQQFDNIVQIIDYDLDCPKIWYSMECLDANSDAILSHTKGNVLKTVKLMLPIVRTLSELASMQNPIYHRDLKSENLLIKKEVEEFKLFLADFGCAYFAPDDAGRITEDNRAVGAQFYRAPEYHYGRVDKVDEKGDIFSLGKLFWYFINGRAGEVFPYTLWFPEEYNLSERFAGIPYINDINLLIASCVNYDPLKRISYSELIKQLENIMTEPVDSSNDLELRLRAFESKDQLFQAESNKIAIELIDFFLDKWNEARIYILNKYPKLDLIERFISSCKLVYQKQSIIDCICNQGINCPLISGRIPEMSFASRIHPAHESKNSLTTYPFIQLGFNTPGKYSSNITIIFDPQKSIYCLEQDTAFSEKTIINLFTDAISSLC